MTSMMIERASERGSEDLLEGFDGFVDLGVFLIFLTGFGRFESLKDLKDFRRDEEEEDFEGLREGEEEEEDLGAMVESFERW